VVKLGLPRVDYILDVTQGDGRYRAIGEMYALYPHLASSEKKVVLYAPTFRRGSMPDIKGLADELDPNEYEIIVRLHPLYKIEEELPHGDNIHYEDSIPTYDLLAASDVVISDYSSLVVEASLADKPMYLYTYDIDSYRETTGLNVDLENEAIGKYVFRDAEALADAMDRQLERKAKHSREPEEPYDMEALRAFRDKYIDINTENCTGQLADFIESLL
jgi:CDP-ribitol ribitolphosphotransferase